MNILVTGCAGFIGSNFCEYLLEKQFKFGISHIIGVDSITKVSDRKFMDALEKLNFKFFEASIAGKQMFPIIRDNHIDVIINLAGETFVDKSVIPRLHSKFMNANFNGVRNILEAVKGIGCLAGFRRPRVIHVSTDEVFGSGGPFDEHSPLNPQNPYSATKAAAECMIKAYRNTYGMKTIIVRLPNVFGPRQHPEKVIPNWTTSLLNGGMVKVYGDGQERRQWIHIKIVCDFLARAAFRGLEGGDYNLGTGHSISNIELAKKIIRLLGRNYSKIRFVQDRKGHDFEYRLKSVNMEELYSMVIDIPSYSDVQFGGDLYDTISWYKGNKWDWWKKRRENR